jgi:aldehyde dehydrogenase (NAD+)
VSAPASVRPAAGKVYRNFIGGEWVASVSPQTVPNVNPADTRDVLGMVSQSTAEEARRAVASAKAAFPAWRDTPAPVRGRILFSAWQLLDKEKHELARLLTREEGKTVKESMGEILRAINVLEFIAAEGRRLGGYVLQSELPCNCTPCATRWRRACITPWNFRWRSRCGRSRRRWSPATRWSSSPRRSRPRPAAPSSRSSSGPGCPRAC